MVQKLQKCSKNCGKCTKKWQKAHIQSDKKATKYKLTLPTQDIIKYSEPCGAY